MASQLGKLFSVLQHAQISKYFCVTSLSILVFDYIMTLSDEVELVWPSRWRTPKFIFLLNRYLPFFDVTLLTYIVVSGSGKSFCITGFNVVAWSFFVGFACAQAILMMRTWAIWERSRFISIFLACLFVPCLAADIYLVHSYLSGVDFIVLPIKFEGCPLSFQKRILFADFVLIISLESIMLGFLVVKALQYFRVSSSSLMRRMFQDGILYFVFILMTSIANTVAILVAPEEMQNFLIIFQRVIHSVLCNRLLLHIRGAYKGVNDPTIPHPNHPIRSTQTTDDGPSSGQYIAHGPRSKTSDPGGTSWVAFRQYGDDGELIDDESPIKNSSEDRDASHVYAIPHLPRTRSYGHGNGLYGGRGGRGAKQVVGRDKWPEMPMYHQQVEISISPSGDEPPPHPHSRTHSRSYSQTQSRTNSTPNVNADSSSIASMSGFEFAVHEPGSRRPVSEHIELQNFAPGRGTGRTQAF